MRKESATRSGPFSEPFLSSRPWPIDAPFPQAEYDAGGALFVAFMKRRQRPRRLRGGVILRARRGRLRRTKGREVYWLRRRQLMESLAVGPPLERYGSPMTVDANTVRWLAARTAADT